MKRLFQDTGLCFDLYRLPMTFNGCYYRLWGWEPIAPQRPKNGECDSPEDVIHGRKQLESPVYLTEAALMQADT